LSCPNDGGFSGDLCCGLVAFLWDCKGVGLAVFAAHHKLPGFGFLFSPISPVHLPLFPCNYCMHCNAARQSNAELPQGGNNFKCITNTFMALFWAQK